MAVFFDTQTMLELAISSYKKSHTYSRLLSRLGIRILFSFGNYRLANGFKYVAKCNLGNEVPYHPFKDYLGRILYPKGISDFWCGALRPIY